MVQIVCDIKFGYYYDLIFRLETSIPEGGDKPFERA
jgi:hypothetical protein